MMEFKLPDIGEGIAEGEIVKWLVKEGQAVEEHQPVVEVMTDKATVEIPAPAPGTITKLRVEEGATVPVGTALFDIDTGQAAGTEPAQEGNPQSATPAPASAGGTQVLDFRLPDVGEGIAEGEIVRWLVQDGQTVEEHQPVVEVMTDKATVEIPAPAPGRIVERLVSEGQMVPVGEVIFRLETAGATDATARAPESVSAGAGIQAGPKPTSNSPVQSGRVRAVPSARRVARELGVDLAQVSGSGRGGIIRRGDVEAFAASGPRSESSAIDEAVERPATTTLGSEQRIPFRGVRRKIAEAMVRSKYTATHFTVVEEIDVTELVALRLKAKALGAERGIKVTYMPFIMKAVAKGLAEHRMLNGHLDEEAGEIVLPARVNLGIATDTPSGLLVPVIRDVQAKDVLQLSAELMDLAERTRTGKVRPEELRGSTFTITNAGNIGGTLATPIINWPDIAILGVHRIVKRPGVVETPEGDQIAVRQYMNLSCSVDHRLADGADAARFLAGMRRRLEDPGLLVL